MKEGLSLFCALFHPSTQKGSGQVIGTHKDVLNKKRNEAMLLLPSTLGILWGSFLPCQSCLCKKASQVLDLTCLKAGAQIRCIPNTLDQKTETSGSMY